jgi:hypothetical protein
MHFRGTIYEMLNLWVNEYGFRPAGQEPNPVLCLINTQGFAVLGMFDWLWRLGSPSECIAMVADVIATDRPDLRHAEGFLGIAMVSQAAMVRIQGDATEAIALAQAGKLSECHNVVQSVLVYAADVEGHRYAAFQQQDGFPLWIPDELVAQDQGAIQHALLDLVAAVRS